MAHEVLDERVLIEVGRSSGWKTGFRGRSCRAFQTELVQFKGLCLEDLEHCADDFSSPTFLSRGHCSRVYRQRGDSLDRLNPLERYLRSHVGMPWDDVKSALKKVIRGRGDSVQHVLGHVREFVEDRPVFRAGIPYGNPGRGSWHYRALRHGDFYVDADGILREGAVRRIR